jgi:hypothetical protein
VFKPQETRKNSVEDRARTLRINLLAVEARIQAPIPTTRSGLLSRIVPLQLGSFWVDVGTISFLAWIAFSALSVSELISRERVNYYLTNSRIVSPKGQVELKELTNVSVRQSSLNSWRGIEDISCETKNGNWITFKRVKDPEMVKNHILRDRDTARGQGESPPLVSFASTGSRTKLRRCVK